MQISPQESKSSVSLCTNIGNMSIPFQIICDSYPRYFMLSMFFQYSALKGVVSLYLTRAASSCRLQHAQKINYIPETGVKCFKCLNLCTYNSRTEDLNIFRHLFFSPICILLNYRFNNARC